MDGNIKNMILYKISQCLTFLWKTMFMVIQKLCFIKYNNFTVGRQMQIALYIEYVLPYSKTNVYHILVI